ncbi:MBG domain-containing protein [Desertivirga brevis]|uniref:MBG domain-containing protein n=1 Tax=Desertivirga brevis TaxID=2810310 RepID=UPI001A95C403|nr:MBG domain-containing protein [Pedobacter sp. SYSU D00873]
MRKPLLLVFLSFLSIYKCFSQTNHVVISEVFGAGTSTNSYRDFVELYNPTGSTIDMSGWSIRYKSATGTAASASLTFPVGTKIYPYGYFLIGLMGSNPNVDPDLSGSIDLSGSTTGGGHVALCLNVSTGTSPWQYQVVDLVAWGTGNTPEESAAPSHPALPGSIERKALSTSTASSMTVGTDALLGNGYDSNDNSKDFIVRTKQDPQSQKSGAYEKTGPPIDNLGYPAATDLTATEFSLQSSLDVKGTSFYVILPDGAEAPSATQVKNGQDAASLSVRSGNLSVSFANKVFTVVLLLLQPNTSYDVYVVSENEQGVLQSSPVKLDITTLSNGDTTSPTITSVTVPSNATYIAGQNLDFTVNFDEKVDVASGTPTLGLTIGTSPVTASYVSGSGTTALLFRYTVASGDEDINGISLASSITANGATLKDEAGNDAILGLTNVGVTGSVKVDAVVPSLSTVTIASNNATNTLAKEGDVITLTIAASEYINTPIVRIAGQNAAVTGSGTSYTATYTITSATTQGPAAIVIAFTDIAGNAGTDVKATTNSSVVTVDRTAPSIPSGLLSTAGDAEINLNWNANTESDLKSYKIYAGTSNNPTVFSAEVDAPTAAKLESGLTNGTTYYYRLTATDKAGNESSYSTTVSATPVGSQTITFNALSNRTYGDASFDLGAEASSNLKVSYESSNTAIASISGNSVTIHKAGTVTITAKQAGNSSYLAAPDVMQTLVINPKALTITANKVTKIYGETLTGKIASTAFTQVGLVGTETIGSVSLAYGTGAAPTAAVNTYTEQITPSAATGGTFTPANYSITYTKGDIVVDPAALTIAAKNASKAYGQTLIATSESIGFVAIGLQNGETVGSVSIAYGAGAAAGDASGTYIDAVTPSAATGGTFTPANYTTTYVKGNIVVAGASQTITFNSLENKTYGDAAFSLSATASSNLTVTYTSSDPGIASIHGNKVTIHKVGTVTITAQQAGNVNFSEATDVEQTLKINPKALTITANKATKTYGESLADETGSTAFTSNGLVGAETIGSVSLAYGTGAAVTAAVDTYINQVTPNTAIGGTFTAANYSITYAKGDLVVNKKAVGVTAVAKNKTYGDTDPELTYSITSGTLVGNDQFSGSLSREAGENVGEYAVQQGSLALSNNYDLSYTGAKLTIGKKAVGVTAVAKNKTYGDTDPELTYSITEGTLVGNDAFSGNLSRKAGENVGEYAIQQGSLALSNNYDLSYTGAKLTIGKKAVGITAVAKNKTYGDTDPEVTYSITEGTLVGNDAFSGNLSRDAGENVGDYTINQGSLALSNNYTLSYTGAKLTIGKKAITVTAAAKNKTYGEADPALSYNITTGTLVGNDGFSGSLKRETGENVGEYTINQGTLTLSDNYTVSYNPAKLTIGKKAIAVTAVAKDKTYGEVDPALSYDITTGALVGNDAFSGALTRDAGEDAGEYKITQGTLALSDNYTLSYTAAKLTIGKKAITVTAVAKDKTYGEADPALSYDITTGALVGNDAFSGALTRDAGEDVGEYKITKGTLALSDNYTLSYNAAKLTIGRKAITVTAVAKDKTYGEVDPALTYNITTGNLVGSDAFNGSLTREIGENVGKYAINQGSLALSDNYTLSYNPAKLTIGKKAIAITAVAKDKTYGEADPALTYNITTGALVGSDHFSGSLSRDAGENVGDYTINQGSLALSNNYTLSYTGAKLTIGKKAITVTAAAKNKTYGEADPALSYNITTGALVGNDAFSGSLTREAGENAGSYSIRQGTLALSANYNLSYNSANLTIAQKALTVTVNNQTKTYGALNPSLTVTYSGLVNGETTLNPAPTVTTAVTAATGIGSYDITAIGTAVNYNVTYVKGTLTVTKAALTITADNKEKIQGIAVPALTASYSGFVNGEDKSVLLTQPVLHTDVVAMTGQGDYPINLSGATAANYAITHIPGILKVKPGFPTGLSLAASTVYENAAAGALAGTLSSTSDDPTTTFAYTFADGAGSADNTKFSIVGNEIRTNRVLNFEENAVYSVRVRTTAQNSLLSLEKEFTISIQNVNEQPTLNNIAAQTICYTPSQQTIALSGISAGEDLNQTTNVTVSSTNSNLFKSLSVTQASNGNAQVRYTVADGASGSAVVNVMVTDNGGTANGGVNTILKSFTLTVNALPVPSITTNKGVTSISKGDELVLKAQGGSTYQWSNAPGILSGDNTANLTIRPDATTTYRVLVTNASGCSETKEITIEVTEDYVMLKGTNLISPNGDGVNDVFKIENVDMYPNNEVKIFDRAGRLLYTKKGYSKDGEWNGTLNGAPLAEDTYYYVVDFGPNKPKIKGYITIVRD